jgi:hypothetical protein
MDHDTILFLDGKFIYKEDRKEVDGIFYKRKYWDELGIVDPNDKEGSEEYDEDLDDEGSEDLDDKEVKKEVKKIVKKETKEERKPIERLVP